MTSRVAWCPSLSPNIDSIRNLTETQRRRTGWHSALFRTHYNHQRERVGGIPPDLNRRKIYRTMYAHNQESSIQNSPKCSLTVGRNRSSILHPERSPTPLVPDFPDNTPVYLQNSHRSTIVPPHDFLSTNSRVCFTNLGQAPEIGSPTRTERSHPKWLPLPRPNSGV
ncbi:hypothetical protein Bbelb_317250 [Branchiostoma belcheri]|nr:hypothetical protein Bbelb_317250 [Branchiostoma belcheri]